MTARQRRSFDSAFTGVFGESPERLYGRFSAELSENAMTVARAGHWIDGELWQETSRGSGDPAVSPDGTKLAMVLRDEKGNAKLVVYSTGPNDEEAKAEKRIAEMLRRDPQDVAPVRAKPLPRKPQHSYQPADGGDIENPRWTRDGAAILYTHRQPDRDGFLHHDLFRWTPATGRSERLTHLADVKGRRSDRCHARRRRSQSLRRVADRHRQSVDGRGDAANGAVARCRLLASARRRGWPHRLGRAHERGVACRDRREAAASSRRLRAGVGAERRAVRGGGGARFHRHREVRHT